MSFASGTTIQTPGEEALLVFLKGWLEKSSKEQ